jgi:hypothetical protein
MLGLHRRAAWIAHVCPRGKFPHLRKLPQRLCGVTAALRLQGTPRYLHEHRYSGRTAIVGSHRALRSSHRRKGRPCNRTVMDASSPVPVVPKRAYRLCQAARRIRASPHARRWLGSARACPEYPMHCAADCAAEAHPSRLPAPTPASLRLTAPNLKARAPCRLNHQRLAV